MQNPNQFPIKKISEALFGIESRQGRVCFYRRNYFFYPVKHAKPLGQVNQTTSLNA